jgi:Ala-tRNA(Pro) deacylase
LKALSRALGLTNLSLASESRLRKHLCIEAGAVSVLAVVNDSEGVVRVVIDRDVWRAETLQCHPLVNTSTLAIRREDLRRLLEITGHTPEVMAIPERR